MTPRIICERAARVIDARTVNLYEDGEHVRTLVFPDAAPAWDSVRAWLLFAPSADATLRGQS